jgi:hypothetical protein
MAQYTQPIYHGNAPEGSFPLSPSPYFSRVEDKNVIFETGEDVSDFNNYQFVAFRPGFSLQASELNEMQENMQLQMSLSISMMHNWITSSASYLWNGWNNQSHTSEGDVADGNLSGFPPNTGIGVGGGNGPDDASDVLSTQGYSISGPGWRGATPLYPFKTPYVGSESNNKSQVSIENNGNGGFDFKFNPGWYLVEVRNYWDGNQDDQPTGVSGLKHWVYLESTKTETITLSELNNAKHTVIGLDVSSKYIRCCSDEAECDAELADNASGTPNSASCGADRYALSINLAKFAQSGAGDVWGQEQINAREKLNAVLYIEKNGDILTARYMNNLMIANSIELL